MTDFRVPSRAQASDCHQKRKVSDATQGPLKRVHVTSDAGGVAATSATAAPKSNPKAVPSATAAPKAAPKAGPSATAAPKAAPKAGLAKKWVG